jgi:hypothetical protein
MPAVFISRAVLAAREPGVDEVTNNPRRTIRAIPRFMTAFMAWSSLALWRPRLHVGRSNQSWKPLEDTPGTLHIVRVGHTFLYLAIKPYFTRGRPRSSRAPYLRCHAPPYTSNVILRGRRDKGGSCRCLKVQVPTWRRPRRVAASASGVQAPASGAIHICCALSFFDGPRWQPTTGRRALMHWQRPNCCTVTSGSSQNFPHESLRFQEFNDRVG